MKINCALLTILTFIVFSCNNVKFGQTVIECSAENSEILIDNFPHSQVGIEGFNTTSYPEGFSLNKLNEEIFDCVTTKEFSNHLVSIKLRFIGQDQYGKDTVGKWIHIGNIDANESKKYANIDAWNKLFEFSKLLEEYNKKYNANNSFLPQEKKNDVLNSLSSSDQTIEQVSTEKNDKTSRITFTYGKGYLTFHNTLKVPIRDLILAYHVNDGNWSGWMTAGKWTVQPGDKFKWPVPLHPNGTLGKEMFYHCMYKDTDDLLYEIGGNTKFMISRNEDFVVLNADAPILHSASNIYLNRFYQIEFGGAYKNFTIGIGVDPEQD
jgi:hypothetical protein